MSEQIHRHAAIMFTDIVGYTALMGSDEDRAIEILNKNKEIHTAIIPNFNGALVKEMGDGLLITFDLASEAVRCAIEIRKACHDQGIPIKIGINEGEIVLAGDDVLGDGVNITFRLQEEAEEGCINISSSVYRDIKNKADIHTKFIGEKAFKNVDEPIKVYRVLREEEEKKAPEKEPKKINKKYLYYLLAAIAIMTATTLVWNYLPQKRTEVLDKSIAVLPFDNLGPPEHAYFVDGMTEEIHTSVNSFTNKFSILANNISNYFTTQYPPY